MPKPEDRKLTAKENYLRILTGQMPEWAPVYTMGLPTMTADEPVPLIPLMPSIVAPGHMDPVNDEKDIFGVTWVGTESTGYAKLPKPNDFILEDICDWRDVIKVPSLEGVDWEAMVQKDLAARPFDRDKTGTGLLIGGGSFQTLISFMGFTEGMIAMYEEPEEVEALIDYYTDFYVEVELNYCKYLKPDVLCLGDDTCTQNAPFMSEEMFKRFCVPSYKKLADYANQVGIPIEFHNCGTAARFIEICHDEFNVTAWDPAQTMNDLTAFKEKWGREIAIVGAWDATGQLLEPDCPDELIRQSVIDTFDKLAPEGGYAFCGGFVGPLGDKNNERKQRVLERTALEYGGSFYD